MLVTLDFETYFDSKVSLTKMTTMEYVKHPMFKVWGVGIKLDTSPTEWFGEDEVEEALNDIEWDKAHLLCHNTPFDGYILTQLYELVPAYYLDTAAMARGRWPGETSRLKDVAVRCFPDDPDMRKGEELVTAKGIYDLPPDIEDSLAGYCIQDVDLTYAIYNQLLPAYPQVELDIIDLTCRMFCEPKMTLNRCKLESFVESERAYSEQAIEKSGLDRKVLASNQQFSAWAEEQGLTVPTKVSPSTGNKIPAFGKNDAAYKQWQQQHPEYNHVWQGREAVKSRLNETRAQRFIDCANSGSRLPAPLRYYAAHTGRFGGTDKINLQNLPRNSELRKAIEAPSGDFLYVADLSNIESRMLAWLAEEDELLQMYRDGTDVYCDFASKVYGRTITKDDEVERFVGKTAILGLGYGMGAQKFQATLKQANIEMDFFEAKNIVDEYRTTYPHITDLWYRLNALLIESSNMGRVQDDDSFGYAYRCIQAAPNAILLPNGMSLRYPSLTSTKAGLTYQSMGKPVSTYGGRITENVVQALARIVLCDHMLQIQRRPEFEVVLTVHDEVIALSQQDNPQDKLDSMIDIMRQPPQWALDLPLDAEGGWDVSYSK
jgi:DNA polymerase